MRLYARRLTSCTVVIRIVGLGERPPGAAARRKQDSGLKVAIHGDGRLAPLCVPAADVSVVHHGFEQIPCIRQFFGDNRVVAAETRSGAKRGVFTQAVRRLTSRSSIFASAEFGNTVTGVFAAELAKHSKSFSLIHCISVGVDRMQRNSEPMRKQVVSLAAK